MRALYLILHSNSKQINKYPLVRIDTDIQKHQITLTIVRLCHFDAARKRLLLDESKEQNQIQAFAEAQIHWLYALLTQGSACIKLNRPANSTSRASGSSMLAHLPYRLCTCVIAVSRENC